MGRFLRARLTRPGLISAVTRARPRPRRTRLYSWCVWIIAACLSALFAGLTSILAKAGVATTSSTVATALRTVVVAGRSVGHGRPGRIGVVRGRYRRTLAAVLSPVGLGNRGLVAVLLRGAGAGKRVSGGSHRQAVDGPRDRPGAHPAGRAGERVGAAGIVAITAGTLLMVEPSDLSGLPRALRGGGSWLVYALASALFAALTSILGKVGISGVDPTLGTAVRTVVVLAMAWVIVTVQGRLGDVRDIPARELAFIVASGAATCASWLAYYHALKDGPASVVVPIDKLSILVTVAFSAAVFHERFTHRYLAGLAFLCVGTGAMVVA